MASNTIFSPKRRGVPSLFDERSVGMSAVEEEKEHGRGRTPEQVTISTFQNFTFYTKCIKYHRQC